MKKLNKKGFTLIEVVLVLAIGGLIFLLAFIAFQQVSANRRDTQRRSDAGRVIAELQNYRGDKGSYPTALATAGAAGTAATSPTFGEFINTYMGGANFKGPQNSPYNLVLVATSLATEDQVKYTPNSNCAGGTTGVKIEVKLEKGLICRDDQ